MYCNQSETQFEADQESLTCMGNEHHEHKCHGTNILSIYLLLLSFLCFSIPPTTEHKSKKEPYYLCSVAVFFFFVLEHLALGQWFTSLSSSLTLFVIVQGASVSTLPWTDIYKRMISSIWAVLCMLQITFDVAWSAECIDMRCYDYAALAEAVDFVFVMQYDTRSQIFGECIAWANAPLNKTVPGEWKPWEFYVRLSFLS